MPFNRFITFVKPYLNLLAGAISAWIIAKANVLDIPSLGEHGDEMTTAIAAALAWIVTQGAAQLGDAKWLKGHQLSLVGDAEVQAAALQAPASVMPLGIGIDPEHDALMELDDDLPDDEEEFAAPPDESNTPVQPSQWNSDVAEPVIA
jgi:hypothetical protein